jgi:hypothetical protein
MSELDASWKRFCDACDAARREMAKQELVNRKLQAEVTATIHRIFAEHDRRKKEAA